MWGVRPRFQVLRLHTARSADAATAAAAKPSSCMQQYYDVQLMWSNALTALGMLRTSACSMQ
jgi:hypothetical protein